MQKKKKNIVNADRWASRIPSQRCELKPPPDSADDKTSCTILHLARKGLVRFCSWDSTTATGQIRLHQTRAAPFRASCKLNPCRVAFSSCLAFEHRRSCDSGH